MSGGPIGKQKQESIAKQALQARKTHRGSARSIADFTNERAKRMRHAAPKGSKPSMSSARRSARSDLLVNPDKAVPAVHTQRVAGGRLGKVTRSVRGKPINEREAAKILDSKTPVLIVSNPKAALRGKSGTAVCLNGRTPRAGLKEATCKRRITKHKYKTTPYRLAVKKALLAKNPDGSKKHTFANGMPTKSAEDRAILKKYGWTPPKK